MAYVTFLLTYLDKYFMDLITPAFSELYPEKEFAFTSRIRYSRQFKPYNARMQRRGNELQLRLSYDWKEIDSNIVQGLVQVLLLRMFGGKQKTLSIDLYHSFLKKIPEVTERGESDPLLEKTFTRLNERFFAGFMEKPTLAWGQASTSTLAHYNLHTDTIVVSTLLKNAAVELLEYVLYHEMLHKKHQFTSSGKHTRFHTSAFRDEEKKFGETERLERELQQFVRGHRRKWRWF